MNVKFNQVAGNIGMRNAQWGKATIYMFGLWTIGTSFVCFEKPDFLNVSQPLNVSFFIANHWYNGTVYVIRPSIDKIIVPQASCLLNAFVFRVRHLLDGREVRRVLGRHQRGRHGASHHTLCLLNVFLQIHSLSSHVESIPQFPKIRCIAKRCSGHALKYI